MSKVIDFSWRFVECEAERILSYVPKARALFLRVVGREPMPEESGLLTKWARDALEEERRGPQAPPDR